MTMEQVFTYQGLVAVRVMDLHPALVGEGDKDPVPFYGYPGKGRE